MLGVSLDDIDSRLIPYTAQELASRQESHLSDILAREYLNLSKGELWVFESAKEHSVAAAKAELIRPFSLGNFVDIACQKLALINFN